MLSKPPTKTRRFSTLAESTARCCRRQGIGIEDNVWPIAGVAFPPTIGYHIHNVNNKRPTMNTKQPADRMEWLEEQEFYELMQTYRHTHITEPIAVLAAFNAVKQFICDKVFNNEASSNP